MDPFLSPFAIKHGAEAAECFETKGLIVKPNAYLLSLLAAFWWQAFRKWFSDICNLIYFGQTMKRNSAITKGGGAAPQIFVFPFRGWKGYSLPARLASPPVGYLYTPFVSC